MLRILKTIGIVTVTVLGIASLCGCSVLPKEQAVLKPPLVKPAQENYRMEKSMIGTIETTVNGEATFQSEAVSKVQYKGQSGHIDQILAIPGHQVKKGDILVKLQLDGLELRLKEQKLALAKAKYAYQQTQAEDKDARDIARLQLEIEQFKFDELNSQLNTRTLKSEIDGVVVFTESLNEGDPVDPYMTLVTVADPSRLRLSLSFDRLANPRGVELGSVAEVDFQSQKLQGKVVQTPSSAPDSRNEDVAKKNANTLYISLPKIPKGAEIGSTAQVKIITNKKENVVLIPKSALRSMNGRNFVRILEDGDKLREVDVEPGIIGSTQVEIVKGLEADKNVVLQ